MSDNLKPIQTLYKGIRYRSRLEARYAVFFDYMQIEVRYESEGYVTEGRAYLPDFYLPNLNQYIEIKPNGDFRTDNLVNEKMISFAKHQENGLLVMVDIPIRKKYFLSIRGSSFNPAIVFWSCKKNVEEKINHGDAFYPIIIQDQFLIPEEFYDISSNYPFNS